MLSCLNGAMGILISEIGQRRIAVTFDVLEQSQAIKNCMLGIYPDKIRLCGRDQLVQV